MKAIIQECKPRSSGGSTLLISLEEVSPSWPKALIVNGESYAVRGSYGILLIRVDDQTWSVVVDTILEVGTEVEVTL